TIHVSQTTTVSLGSSSSVSVYGQGVTFTATVTPQCSGTPTGSVTFLDGSIVLGTATLASAQATFSASSLAYGLHNITAVYSGDANCVGSTSSALAQTVNQAPLTVSAVSQTRVYGAANPALTWTYSGLANGDMSATFTGSLATTATPGSGVGTYPITQATLAATGNYTIGTFNSANLTVNAAALGITANADSKTYGQTKTYGAGSSAFTSSGLQNSETIGSVTITASGGAAANAAVGSYNLTPSAATGGTFAASNYTITYHDGTLAVNAAGLDVTANADSKTYGQTKTYGVGSTAFTSSGLQNGETIGSVTITASGGSAANAAVGSYNLTPSAPTGGTFTASNYTIAYHDGTLTVNPAALDVTANADSKTYGQTKTYGVGSTAFTSGGLQNGETIGSVTITASGGTAANAAVGSYNLTPSAAAGGTFAASNYTITYHDATLAVNAAVLNITANADSKTYGQTKTYGAGSTAFTSSGLQNGETIGSVTITASGGAAANAAVGSYNLTPSAAMGGTFAASNYTISYHDGTLTVNPLAVSLTGSRNYDGTATVLAGILSVANKVGADTVSVASGSGTLASAAAGVRAIIGFGTLALGNNAAATTR
ncbi:MAG: MBG domain-containing protein, partial [Planctomycetota bacterium]